MVSILRIYYVANTYYDLCFYMAQILNNAGKRVAVEDVSDESLLTELIPDMDRQEIWTYKGVDYVRGELCDCDVYDIVITNCDIYYLINRLLKDNAGAEASYDARPVIVYNSDLGKHDVSNMCSIAKCNPVNVIVRDVISDNMGISYIKKKIQHMCDKSEELSECITYYVSNMDIIDYRYRIDMEYEGYTQFDNLSWGYGKMITGLMTDITGYDRKELWHAFRHAREGKIIENSSVG